jgi:hypothetical protein
MKLRDRAYIIHPYANNSEENFKRVDKICRCVKRDYGDMILPVSPIHFFSYFDKDEPKFRDDVMQFSTDCIENMNIDKGLMFGISSGCMDEANICLEHNVLLYIAKYYDEGDIIKSIKYESADDKITKENYVDQKFYL